MLFKDGVPPVFPPSNCRMQQEHAGLPYPRSGCEVCFTGGLIGCPYISGADCEMEAGVVAEKLNKLALTRKPTMLDYKLLRRAVILLLRQSNG